MTIESFVRAMPKVEINLRLEGAIDPQVLTTIAEQNDVPLTTKSNKALLKLIKQPEYAQIDDLISGTSKWLQQPEDFTRVVYEAGVDLVKQNVRYAEIGIAPALYAENGLTFEQLLTALNDGRSRVERAWNTQIRWVLNVYRDAPRTLDDVIRWASSAAAIKGGVVGIGLVGREIPSWVEDFERPFRTAQKKDLARSVEMFSTGDEIPKVLAQYAPERVSCSSNVTDNAEVMRFVSDQQVVLSICMAHDICSSRVTSYSAFPLKRLYDDGAVINLGSGMPNLYHTNLVHEYLSTVNEVGLSVSELETISLNAIRASFMAEENKAKIIAEFKSAYAQLRGEHNVTVDAL